MPSVFRPSLREDELSSQPLVLINRRRDRVRLGYWNGSGLWVMTKRLGADAFHLLGSSRDRLPERVMNEVALS